MYKIVLCDWIQETLWIRPHGMHRVFPVSFEMAGHIGIEVPMISADPITQILMTTLGIGYMDVTKDMRRRLKESVFRFAYTQDYNIDNEILRRHFSGYRPKDQIR